MPSIGVNAAILVLLIVATAPEAPAWSSAELVLQTGHAGYVDFLVFSTRGDTLLSHGADGSLRVWDLRTNSIRRSWDQDAFLSDNLGSFAISPTGDHVLLGSPLGHADFFDVVTGKEGSGYIPSLDPDAQKSRRGSPISAAAESPDGQWVVAANVDGEILGFSTKSDAARIMQRSGSPAAVMIRFNARSTSVLFERLDGSLMVYSLESGTKVGTPKGFKKSATADVGFSASDDILLVDITQGGLVLSNVSTATQRSVTCHCIHPHISGDGTRIAALEGDEQEFSRVRVWSTTDLRELPSFPSPPIVYRIGLSTDGQAVAVGGFDGSVSIATTAGLHSLSGRLRTPKSLEILDDGELLVIDTEGGMRIWTPKQPSTAMLFKGSVLSRTTVTTDARFAAVVGDQDTLRLSNPETRVFEDLGIKIPKFKVHSLSISEDGARLIWSTGSSAIDSEALDRWIQELTKSKANKEADKLPDPGIIVSSKFILYTAVRQEGWKTEQVCEGENPIAVEYRGKLVGGK